MMWKWNRLVPTPRQVRRIALPLGLVLAAVAVLRPPPRATPASGEPAPAPLIEPATVVMQVDTPPPVPARGWPFRELPLVLKREWPTPRLAIVPVPPPPYVRITLPPRPPAVPPPEVPPESPGGPPLWLGVPLVVGAGLGAAQADETFPGQVVPEPATVLLLSTGLALIGSARRRRGPAGPTGRARGRARRDPPRA